MTLLFDRGSGSGTGEQKRISASRPLDFLAAGKVHKTVTFAGETTKNAKSAKRIV